MIDLYTAPTPNGWKVSIMLEELGAALRGARGAPRPARAEGASGSCASTRTGASRRSSTATPATSPSSSRARSCSTWPRRPASCCPADAEGPLARDPVADVPDGRRRADAGPGQRVLPLRAGEDPVRDRALPERDAAPLRGARPAARRGRVPGRRLLDRRHRHLAVGDAPRLGGRASRRPRRTCSAGSKAVGERPAVQRGRAIPVLPGTGKLEERADAVKESARKILV